MSKTKAAFAASDRPVTEDKLGMRERCEGIAKFITGCSTPMTISILGDWGTGKTTAMRLIQQGIRDKDKADGGTVEPVQIWFNTWQYSIFNSRGKLIIDLMTALQCELDKKRRELSKNHEKELNTCETKEIWEKLTNGEQGEKVFKLIKHVGRGVAATVGAVLNLNPFFDFFNTLGDNIEKTEKPAVNSDNTETKAESTALIAELKENIESQITTISEAMELLGGNKNIYFFIDDLDRIEPIAAVELLEGLKNFVDCEGCVFVLAVDSEVVKRGLRSKYGNDFGDDKADKFFDKIIQVPYHLPVKSYEITEYVKELAGVDEGENLNAYLEIIKAFNVSNPRTIKRSFNLLNLYDCIKNVNNQTETENPAARIRQYAIHFLRMNDIELYNEIVEKCREADIRNSGDIDDNDENLIDFKSKLVECTGANPELEIVLEQFDITLDNIQAEEQADTDNQDIDKIKEFIRVLFETNRLVSDDTDSSLFIALYRRLKSMLNKNIANGNIAFSNNNRDWIAKNNITPADVNNEEVKGVRFLDGNNPLAQITRKGEAVNLTFYYYNGETPNEIFDGITGFYTGEEDRATYFYFFNQDFNYHYNRITIPNISTFAQGDPIDALIERYFKDLQGQSQRQPQEQA